MCDGSNKENLEPGQESASSFIFKDSLEMLRNIQVTYGVFFKPHECVKTEFVKNISAKSLLSFVHGL